MNTRDSADEENRYAEVSALRTHRAELMKQLVEAGEAGVKMVATINALETENKRLRAEIDGLKASFQYQRDLESGDGL